MSDPVSVRRLGRGAAPYLLSLPSWAYLAAFFIIPLVSMLSMSLAKGNPLVGYAFAWNFAEFGKAVTQYNTQLIRSFWYGALSTFITLVITYPVAYWIAFYGGKHKGTFLFLILLPFFVSFVIRTLAWQFILSDQGLLLGTLKALHLLPKTTYVLSTPAAVVGGLVYNSVAYYILPLYVALEKVDRRVVRAAGDLYASPSATFWKVILPLSAPGIFAGFLLVFVTNVGDFVNAAVLGGPGTRMIGNIIQYNFFDAQNYPMAAALSSILMFLLILAIYLYARVFGAEQIQEYAA
ncbi:ABC transporter permease [Acidimangrovimonas sediminis]|uniref:ABC transporter permease n=1 Tax=Acidimangrovimonas sediminis TaxID=2056283 RepID=UPI000C7FF859|nr:ABC transporter permease [Acidimangrovimonas sediminis]